MFFIIVRFSWEGIHYYPNCPIESVGYLKFPHRHLFQIRCEKHVDTEDREIEILAFRTQIIADLNCQFPEGNLESWSCETLCQYLMKKWNLSLVEVLEDGENGAKKTAD
jgi:hypothetical protein